MLGLASPASGGGEGGVAGASGEFGVGGVLESWIERCRAVTLETPERGVRAGERLVLYADRLGDARLRARARSAWCQALSYSGRLSEAQSVSAEAIVAGESSGDDAALAEACLTAVQSHNLLGLRSEALVLASRAGELFGRIGDAERAGTSTMLAGVVLRMLDRPVEALARFGAAGDQLRTRRDLSAQLASNRAEALLDLGRFDEARASFVAALEGFRACGQAFGEGIVEGNLADLASRQGKLREGLGLFLRAIGALRSIGEEPEAARLEAEAAELFLAIGDHREALGRLPGAIRALTSAGMQTETMRARLAYGVALGLAGRLESALRELDAARSEALAHGQAQSVARSDALAGGVLLASGETAAALGRLESSLGSELFEPARARTLIDLARARLMTGDARGAAEAVGASARLVDSLGLLDLEPELLAVRASVARRGGELSAARSALRMAIERLELLRGSLGADRLRASVVGRRRLIFDEGAALALETGSPELAFEMAERAAGRSLVESSATELSGDSAEGPSGLEGTISALLRSIEGARRLGRDDSAISGLLRELALSQERLASEEVRRDRIGPAARGAVVGSEACAASLPDGVVCVQIVPFGDGLATVLTTRAGQRLDRAGLGLSGARSALGPLLTDIDRALVRLALLRPLPASLSAAIDERLTVLGEGLLGHLRGELSGCGGVLLMLPRELSGLPVAALRVDGASLVELCVPAVVPSMTWACRSWALRAVGARRGVLAVGFADEQAPSIDAELSVIGSCVDGSSVLRGCEATFGGLSRGAPGAAVVHLSCHAAYAPEDPMGSRVRLADGWISARRLAGLDLRGAEVVLGGCETAASDAAHAGEFFGLVRAVLLAGASGVVASQWRLHDAAAGSLLKDLYGRGAGEGSRTMRALASAQAERARAGEPAALWGGLLAIGWCV